MRLLLRVYPRRWRERYGDELLALLEAEPLTWRVRANVVGSGFAERFQFSGRRQVRVLWAWSLVVIGGMAFQKTSEHWQLVVPSGDRGVPTAAFDVVQTAAALGSAAVLLGVAIAMPAFVRDLRTGGWNVTRRPLLVAMATTVLAAGGLLVLAIDHDVVAAMLFLAFALWSLFAWTHAAAVAAQRLPPMRLHAFLAAVVGAAMLVITTAVGVWFASVTAHTPNFVGTVQLVVVTVFLLAGTALATAGGWASIRA